MIQLYFEISESEKNESSEISDKLTLINSHISLIDAKNQLCVQKHHLFALPQIPDLRRRYHLISCYCKPTEWRRSHREETSNDHHTDASSVVGGFSGIMALLPFGHALATHMGDGRCGFKSREELVLFPRSFQ